MDILSIGITDISQLNNLTKSMSIIDLERQTNYMQRKPFVNSVIFVGNFFRLRSRLPCVTSNKY